MQYKGQVVEHFGIIKILLRNGYNWSWWIKTAEDTFCSAQWQFPFRDLAVKRLFKALRQG